MGVTVTRDFGPLRDVLPGGTGLMREIGDFAVAQIRRRTERSVDATGASFQPLSEGYAKQKQKHLGHRRPDLQVSGRMLNDMGVVAVTERRAEISFRSQGGTATGRTFIQRSRSVGAADKAFYHVTGNRGVVRDFFALSDEDETAIYEFAGRDVDRRVDEL